MYVNLDRSISSDGDNRKVKIHGIKIDLMAKEFSRKFGKSQAISTGIKNVQI